MDNPQNKAQIVYFSHGGGPLPILGDASHKAMVAFMEQLPARLKKPEAIVVISAHWEESAATLLGAVTPHCFTTTMASRRKPMPSPTRPPEVQRLPPGLPHC